MNGLLKSLRLLLLVSAVSPPAFGKDVDFRREVLPLLSENCFECHGPDPGVRKADLRLDLPEGRKDWTKLLLKISSAQPDERMPPPEPGKQLKAAEIEILRRWIESGAKYEAHWAFLPIKVSPPPPSKTRRRVRSIAT